jgi:hypothetical protein
VEQDALNCNTQESSSRETPRRTWMGTIEEETLKEGNEVKELAENRVW